MTTSDLNLDTLINVISDAIAERVQQRINIPASTSVPVTPNPSEEFLDTKQTMEFIRVKSPNTLYKYVNEGRIPKPIKRGVKPFFRKSDLLNYLNHG